FGDDGGAFGLGDESHVLRLHVGGEAGVFLGSHVGADEFVAAADAKRSLADRVDANADLLHFGDDGAEVFGGAIFDGEIATGNGAGDEKCAGLDAVGNDGVFA